MPRRLPKVSPKKITATDDIFAQVTKVNRMADQDETVLRVSMDAKARVKIGAFSRGGTSRIEVKASDHDFNSKESVTPVEVALLIKLFVD